MNDLIRNETKEIKELLVDFDLVGLNLGHETDLVQEVLNGVLFVHATLAFQLQNLLEEVLGAFYGTLAFTITICTIIR